MRLNMQNIRPGFPGIRVVAPDGLTARELLDKLDDPDFKLPETRAKVPCKSKSDKERRRKLRTAARKVREEIEEEARLQSQTLPRVRSRVLRAALVRDGLREKTAKRGPTKQTGPYPEPESTFAQARCHAEKLTRLRTITVAPECQRLFGQLVRRADEIATLPREKLTSRLVSNLKSCIHRMEALVIHTEQQHNILCSSSVVINPFPRLADYLVARLAGVPA
jgi:hypothetical protein